MYVYCNRLLAYGKSGDANEDSGIYLLDQGHLVSSTLPARAIQFCAYHYHLPIKRKQVKLAHLVALNCHQ